MPDEAADLDKAGSLPEANAVVVRSLGWFVDHWDVAPQSAPWFDIIEERHFEKRCDGMCQSLAQGIAYDHADVSRRYGILSLKCRRRQ